MTAELRKMFKQLKKSNITQCSVSRKPAILAKQDGVTVYLATAPEHCNLIGQHVVVDTMPGLDSDTWDMELLRACQNADHGESIVVHVGQWC